MEFTTETTIKQVKWPTAQGISDTGLENNTVKARPKSVPFEKILMKTHKESIK